MFAKEELQEFAKELRKSSNPCTLKYVEGGVPAIKGLKRVSKPGLRIYSNAAELPKVMKGLGTAIISTSKGVMTDREARKMNIGGEVLAFIW